MTDKSRILLLLPTRTYRATDFLEAASKLDVEVVVASEEAATTADLSPRHTLVLDFSAPTVATQAILEFDDTYPLAAIVGVDDDTTLLATTASEALGLPHNPVASAKATRNKYLLRDTLAANGVSVPTYQRFSIYDDPTEIVGVGLPKPYSGVGASNPDSTDTQVRFPCVIKPLSLSASRGVIRADTPAEFIEAFQRTTKLLHALQAATEANSQEHVSQYLLVEDYIPGIEVALEGILLAGELKTLALFDKPDPLEGPFFEETLYITPSRLSVDIQDALHNATAEAAHALGLRHGPVHAELRYNDKGAHLIEIAARTIGGLCARTLRFGTGMSLEELVIRHAMGQPVEALQREQQAAGVMMIPVPEAGILGEVRGKTAAHHVDGIVEVNITIPIGGEVVPLPEGARYLGFIFARAETPAAVETALREAHQQLEFVILPCRRDL
ncbi:ATP-grasp domain-containing protein [Candidatus Poribacteria bacterium]|nr:ATP-grasp domain-containing protein [Candidatus Poribacteria bacterium]MYH80570.1 ATP-grasp domain-containing protein [Candidatus Poribacteria bacterium]MYK95584.1 ATP-grasp domain-containing protein [Candidatus Poribacteria bacterium]